MTKTAQDQRGAILRILGQYKANEKTSTPDGNGWYWIGSLNGNLIRIMELVPEKYEEVGCAFWRKTHSEPVFSKKDQQKVSLVIKHMEEQGFIRISKSGKAFKVLKTK